MMRFLIVGPYFARLTFRARAKDPGDVCPLCKRPMPELVVDAQKWGRHRIVYCAGCGMTSLDGEAQYPVLTPTP